MVDCPGMKYKAIFFDVDGVLVKSKYLFTERLEEEYGIGTKKTLPFFKGVFRQCTIGNADLKEELLKVIEDWGWKGSVKELMDFWFTQGSEIDRDVIEYAKTLHESGIRCFLTTDQEKYRGEHFVKTLGNNKFFEEVFYSAKVGHPKKTEPFWVEVFAKINEASRDTSSDLISRDQTLFVDDDEININAVAGFQIESLLYCELGDLKKKLSE